MCLPEEGCVVFSSMTSFPGSPGETDGGPEPKSPQVLRFHAKIIPRPGSWGFTLSQGLGTGIGERGLQRPELPSLA